MCVLLFDGPHGVRVNSAAVVVVTDASLLEQQLHLRYELLRAINWCVLHTQNCAEVIFWTLVVHVLAIVMLAHENLDPRRFRCAFPDAKPPETMHLFSAFISGLVYM